MNIIESLTLSNGEVLSLICDSVSNKIKSIVFLDGTQKHKETTIEYNKPMVTVSNGVLKDSTYAPSSSDTLICDSISHSIQGVYKVVISSTDISNIIKLLDDGDIDTISKYYKKVAGAYYADVTTIVQAPIINKPITPKEIEIKKPTVIKPEIKRKEMPQSDYSSPARSARLKIVNNLVTVVSSATGFIELYVIFITDTNRLEIILSPSKKYLQCKYDGKVYIDTNKNLAETISRESGVKLPTKLFNKLLSGMGGTVADVNLNGSFFKVILRNISRSHTDYTGIKTFLSLLAEDVPNINKVLEVKYMGIKRKLYGTIKIEIHNTIDINKPVRNHFMTLDNFNYLFVNGKSTILNLRRGTKYSIPKFSEDLFLKPKTLKKLQ